jgi:hypothetical protein
VSFSALRYQSPWALGVKLCGEKDLGLNGRWYAAEWLGGHDAALWRVFWIQRACQDLISGGNRLITVTSGSMLAITLGVQGPLVVGVVRSSGWKSCVRRQFLSTEKSKLSRPPYSPLPLRVPRGADSFLIMTSPMMPLIAAGGMVSLALKTRSSQRSCLSLERDCEPLAPKYHLCQPLSIPTAALPSLNCYPKPRIISQAHARSEKTGVSSPQLHNALSIDQHCPNGSDLPA